MTISWPPRIEPKKAESRMTLQNRSNIQERNSMIQEQQPAISLYGIGMIALGALSVLYRDFAFDWQPVPPFHPGRDTLAVACGLFLMAAGLGMLFRATVTPAVRALFPVLLAWFCLKAPAVIAAPQIEGVWIGFGEIGMLLAGGWVLFASFSGLENTLFFAPITGTKGLRIAQILFGLAVLPVGLGHIFYAGITATLVPSWLPFRTSLAYLTGFGQIACGLAMLISFLPRAAAILETAMLALFAFLVWGPDTWISGTPKMAGTPPGPRFPLTAFLITWIVGASAWLFATNAVKQGERLIPGSSRRSQPTPPPHGIETSR
jgi:uncharacterized membrane protein